LLDDELYIVSTQYTSATDRRTDTVRQRNTYASRGKKHRTPAVQTLNPRLMEMMKTLGKLSDEQYYAYSDPHAFHMSVISIANTIDYKTNGQITH